MNKKALGIKGEQIAAEYLKSKGYKILEINYRNKIGEIDIVSYYENYHIFIEVKNRSTFMYGHPSEAVNKAKQRKIKLVALAYMQKHNLIDANVRFDVVEVSDSNVISVIENAF